MFSLLLIIHFHQQHQILMQMTAESWKNEGTALTAP